MAPSRHPCSGAGIRLLPFCSMVVGRPESLCSGVWTSDDYSTQYAVGYVLSFMAEVHLHPSIDWWFCPGWQFATSQGSCGLKDHHAVAKLHRLLPFPLARFAAALVSSHCVTTQQVGKRKMEWRRDFEHGSNHFKSPLDGLYGALLSDTILNPLPAGDLLGIVAIR